MIRIAGLEEHATVSCLERPVPSMDAISRSCGRSDEGIRIRPVTQVIF